MSIIEEKWEEIIDLLCTDYSVSYLSYQTWLKPMKVKDFHGNTLTISTGKEEGVAFISRKYRKQIETSVRDVTGIECEVVFESEGGTEDGSSLSNKAVDPMILKKIDEANINKSYSFENFVVGNNNNFAHAAAVAVSESPGDVYNPLFIHGGAGLGKTHLMQAIARHIIENDPLKKVLYVTSELFTNNLIESIRKGQIGNDMSMENFRDHYRNVDVLLIDDIQFIIGKESTQEEFFHTFNHLHMAGKQIVISSDQPPKNMTTLEERLRTRFEWGLIADMQRPNFETKMAILHKKIEVNNYGRYNIPNEVLEYIAINVESNIRELEGCLNQVVAYAVLNRKGNDPIEIDLPLATEAIKDIINQSKTKTITPELVMEVVADHYSIPVSDIKSSKRNREVAVPRQIIMYLCRKMTDCPLKTIGIAVGGKDHSTISHGIEKIENDLKTDESLKKDLDVIAKKIRAL